MSLSERLSMTALLKWIVEDQDCSILRKTRKRCLFPEKPQSDQDTKGHTSLKKENRTELPPSHNVLKII